MFVFSSPPQGSACTTGSVASLTYSTWGSDPQNRVTWSNSSRPPKQASPATLLLSLCPSIT